MSRFYPYVLNRPGLLCLMKILQSGYLVMATQSRLSCVVGSKSVPALPLAHYQSHGLVRRRLYQSDHQHSPLAAPCGTVNPGSDPCVKKGQMTDDPQYAFRHVPGTLEALSGQKVGLFIPGSLRGEGLYLTSCHVDLVIT